MVIVVTAMICRAPIDCGDEDVDSHWYRAYKVQGARAREAEARITAALALLSSDLALDAAVIHALTGGDAC